MSNRHRTNQMHYTKRIVFFIFFLLCGTIAGFSDDLTYTRTKTASLDINLSKIHVIITPFDGASIAYRFELTQGKKPSCIETYRTLRIRALTPAEGTLYLFIPEKKILESCIIHSNQANSTIEGIQAAHFLLTANNGTVGIIKSTLKSAVITTARSTITCNIQIIGSCAFSISGSTADVTFTGASSLYHLDYMHSNSVFSIDSSLYEKSPGEYGNAKSKRRLIFSLGSSNAAIRFSPQAESAQIENQYTILP